MISASCIGGTCSVTIAVPLLGRQEAQGEVGFTHCRKVPLCRLDYFSCDCCATLDVFAEFGSNKLASIDPATMTIHEYALPNAESRPRRIAITTDDAIWYTDYAGGHLGRFDPKIGERVAFALWCELGTLWDRCREGRSGVSPNTLVQFDPATEKFQTWEIPSGGGVVRNMMATQDVNLVLAPFCMRLIPAQGRMRFAGARSLHPSRNDSAHAQTLDKAKPLLMNLFFLDRLTQVSIVALFLSRHAPDDQISRLRLPL